MKRSKVAFGAMMLALIGFAAGSAYAQEEQWQQEPCKGCPEDNTCPQPVDPGPCHEAACPNDGCIPDIQSGHCWSLCVYPGKFKTVYDKEEIGSSCPTPRVEQSGTETISVNKTVQEACYALERAPAECEQKQVGWEYVVTPTEETITYTTCEDDGGRWEPTYDPITKTITVDYEKPYGLKNKTRKTKRKVEVKSAWDHLYMKRGSCPDCFDVCQEDEGPEYDWIYGRECKDGECRFGSKKLYTKCSYDFKQCVPPPTPPPANCTTRTMTVAGKPIIDKKPVFAEVCSCDKVQKVPISKVVEEVACSVPSFETFCDPGDSKTKCVEKKVQVCEPGLEWKKEWFCNYNDKIQDIKRVQNALVQEGFDPGPIDGLLGRKTRQAIRDFQQLKGLAQGGTLTRETVQALGIIQE